MDPSFGPSLLSALLPLGTELMASLDPSQNTTHASIFKDFFDCLVSLAGTNKNNGHLQLARAVVEWIPKCDPVTPAMPLIGEAEEKEEVSGKNAARTIVDGSDVEVSLSPINSFFQYLSQLTTAVQFCGNVTEYTEKRGVAAEDDPLFDDSDGNEEAGLGGTGGMAEEEDSSLEEAVSGVLFLAENFCSTVEPLYDVLLERFILLRTPQSFKKPTY